VGKILQEVKTLIASERFCQHCLDNLKVEHRLSKTVKCSRKECRKERLLIYQKPWYNCKIPWLKLAPIMFLYLNNTSNKVIKLLTDVSLRTIGRVLKLIGGELGETPG
jgi:hypothetical protein